MTSINGGFKYLALRNWIIEQIQTGALKNGDRLPSEQALCSRFSFSRQTVRNAIDTLARDGTLRTVKGSGTYVANAGGLVRNKTIGVIFSCLNDYIFPSILRGVESTLSKNGYATELAITNNRWQTEGEILERMLHSGLSGLLVEGTCSALPNPNMDTYFLLKQKQLPVVFMHNYYDKELFPSVLINDRESAEAVTRRLIEGGHKRIAGLFKIDDMQGRERLGGYLQALHDAQLEIREDDIYYYTTKRKLPLEQTGVLEAFTGKVPCTAVMCYNDQIAGELHTRLSQEGIRGVAIGGIDDAFETQPTSMRIVTAKHPKEAIGEEAAKRILQMMGDGIESVPCTPFMLTTELVEKTGFINRELPRL